MLLTFVITLCVLFKSQEKQSADGQAQLDVGGEAHKVRGKILDLAIFSSQEALSLHFSFKLGTTITLLSSTEPQRLRLCCNNLIEGLYP